MQVYELCWTSNCESCDQSISSFVNAARPGAHDTKSSRHPDTSRLQNRTPSSPDERKRAQHGGAALDPQGAKDVSDVFPRPVSWLLGAVILLTTASSPSHQTVWQWSTERRGASSYSGASAPVLHRFPWSARSCVRSAKGISVFGCPAGVYRRKLARVNAATRGHTVGCLRHRCSTCVQRRSFPEREYLWQS
jgi:hypothetical protein